MSNLDILRKSIILIAHTIIIICGKHIFSHNRATLHLPMSVGRFNCQSSIYNLTVHVLKIYSNTFQRHISHIGVNVLVRICIFYQKSKLAISISNQYASSYIVQQVPETNLYKINFFNFSLPL